MVSDERKFLQRRRLKSRKMCTGILVGTLALTHQPIDINLPKANIAIPPRTALVLYLLFKADTRRSNLPCGKLMLIGRGIRDDATKIAE